MGAYAHKHSDIRYAVRALTGNDIGSGKSGHPDYTVIVPPFGFFIEVKGADLNFPLDEISEAQRAWMDEFQMVSYIWLFMGDGRVNGTERPRKAYLVPWYAWIQIERKLFQHGLKGIPYQPHSLEHRELGLSAHSLLGRFELQWDSGKWRIPRRHHFWVGPLADTQTLFYNYRDKESPDATNLDE